MEIIGNKFTELERLALGLFDHSCGDTGPKMTDARIREIVRTRETGADRDGSIVLATIRWLASPSGEAFVEELVVALHAHRAKRAPGSTRPQMY